MDEAIRLKISNSCKGRSVWNKGLKLNEEQKSKVYRSHGLSKTRINNIRFKILSRCNSNKDKAYKYYGGRGIKCLWNSFEESYKDMGNTYKDELTIDRINNNGNYCKENCRWIMQKEQVLNTRRNRYIEHNGLKLTVSQRGEKLGIKKSTFSMRYYVYKRPIEKLLGTKNITDGNIISSSSKS